MKTEFFKIKGTLERASRSDFYDNQGYFLTGKQFFQKDYWTKKFITIWNCPNDYPFATKDDEYFMTKEYFQKEIDDLLRHGLLYKLSSTHRELDFHFGLFIKTANYEDLFHNENQLKLHTCFYDMFQGSVTGPKYINEFDSAEKIIKRIQDRTICVLSRKQLFEPITIAKAS